MTRIQLSVADFGLCHILADRLLDWVVDRYEVRYSSHGAPYVLHSCNGYDVLKHPGVRIFVTGENVVPDFNICDYAFGFQRLDFGDRYCRLPLYRLDKVVYERLRQARPPVDVVLRAKTGFCAAVISNTRGAPARSRLVELLNACRRVDMGGSWRNNVGGPVADKLRFLSRYKFAVACENSSTPGYATEKIADAFASQAIPIYWGDPEIAQDFNPEAFVNCHAFGSLEAAVERVRQIDRDECLYRRMLAAPCFREGREPAHLQEARFRAFLANIFDQPWEQAFRRNRGYWGRKHERRQMEAFHQPQVQVLRCIQALSRHRRQALHPYAWQPAPLQAPLPFEPGVDAECTRETDVPAETPAAISCHGKGCAACT